MPCTEFGGHSGALDQQRHANAERRVDTLAQLLCRLCQRIQAFGQAEEYIACDDELAAWWAEHQEWDTHNDTPESQK